MISRCLWLSIKHFGMIAVEGTQIDLRGPKTQSETQSALEPLKVRRGVRRAWGHLGKTFPLGIE